MATYLSELFARLTALDAEAKELGIATLPAMAGWLSTEYTAEEAETAEDAEEAE